VSNQRPQLGVDPFLCHFAVPALPRRQMTLPISRDFMNCCNKHTWLQLGRKLLLYRMAKQTNICRSTKFSDSQREEAAMRLYCLRWSMFACLKTGYNQNLTVNYRELWVPILFSAHFKIPSMFRQTLLNCWSCCTIYYIPLTSMISSVMVTCPALF